jgi:hypothetical protein
VLSKWGVLRWSRSELGRLPILPDYLISIPCIRRSPGKNLTGTAITNTPAFAASQAGPFDQWPVGMGFDYFYGFVGGDANQWAPNLFRNTTAIYPYQGHPGWNLTTAMADDAIEYMTG